MRGEGRCKRHESDDLDYSRRWLIDNQEVEAGDRYAEGSQISNSYSVPVLAVREVADCHRSRCCGVRGCTVGSQPR
jgi:hypothetical protein